jgi:hypothetical protein
MQGNPRRRAIYRQYCQMHRATKLVYDSFRVHAVDQQPVPLSSGGGYARFESKQQHLRSRWAYYAGGLAAAACLALVFVRLHPSSSPTAPGGPLANLDSRPAAQVTAALPPVPAVSASVREPAAPPVHLVSLRNNAGEPDYAAWLAALRQDEQRAFPNGQAQYGRVPSLFDDGVFDSRQVLPANSQRVFRGRQTPAQQAEFTAFQFQR